MWCLVLRLGQMSGSAASKCTRSKSAIDKLRPWYSGHTISRLDRTQRAFHSEEPGRRPAERVVHVAELRREVATKKGLMSGRTDRAYARNRSARRDPAGLRNEAPSILDPVDSGVEAVHRKASPRSSSSGAACRASLLPRSVGVVLSFCQRLARPSLRWCDDAGMSLSRGRRRWRGWRGRAAASVFASGVVLRLRRESCRSYWLSRSRATVLSRNRALTRFYHCC